CARDKHYFGSGYYFDYW
nr:immunoglobulin heavy chain junction region [Macaca mulatta]MPN83317.1 immunoglobulin heavy chain junction region [Macaca mulatta]MPN83323.1 immunoglobulin heavy chain junction region [Macaca mulatta]MPN83383.1 immunoglobulin heavy chain junction region [Macaca mulatta]MPN83400.1 immunoglobulin heavy chain junction region [Macaca mulatta]